MSNQTITKMQSLLAEAAEELREHRDSLIETHTVPSTRMIDDIDARLAIESMTDLIERLSAAALPFMNKQDDNDFPLGNACDLSGEGECEACT